MNLSEQLGRRDVEVARREVDGRTEIAADFGPATNASVDVLEDTVIVVAGDEQYELEVGPGAQAFMQNGILTIEVNE
ncbi:MAG: hypothetical protein ABEH64_13860 [Salinirussus sp.]